MECPAGNPIDRLFDIPQVVPWLPYSAYPIGYPVDYP